MPHVVEVSDINSTPVALKVTTAIECGIVVNTDAAKNMIEGAIIDGIGNALYGEMTFTNGKPDKENFLTYKMIRLREAPKEIDIHFVENQEKPTGLGEPPFPPIFAALTNALYQSEGKRLYHQPFTKDWKL